MDHVQKLSKRQTNIADFLKILVYTSLSRLFHFKKEFVKGIKLLTFPKENVSVLNKRIRVNGCVLIV